MAWAVVTLLILLGTLLLVVIVALFKYLQLSRIQDAVENAWLTDGTCTGRGEELDCKLHVRDDLEGPPQTVLVPDFDPKLGRRLADYVSRVEMVELPSIPLPPKHEHVGLYQPQVGPPFGSAWLYESNTLIIAFRCTITHHEIQDDLNAWQVNFDSGERVDNVFKPNEGPDIRGTESYIHSGFFNVYMRYRDEVLATIQTHKPKIILLCGHSLGGAVASLMALGLSESAILDSDQQIGCYVFGTPRVGNAAFDKRLRDATHVKTFWRLVNKADNIQDLPFYVTPNLKYPIYQPFYYEHAGPAHEYYENWGSWRVNHFLPNYMSYLGRIL